MDAAVISRGSVVFSLCLADSEFLHTVNRFLAKLSADIPLIRAPPPPSCFFSSKREALGFFLLIDASFFDSFGAPVVCFECESRILCRGLRWKSFVLRPSTLAEESSLVMSGKVGSRRLLPFLEEFPHSGSRVGAIVPTFDSANGIIELSDDENVSW